MEELFLGGVLTADELHIINHQHVDRAKQLFERHDVFVAKRPDELVHELFSGQVDHATRRVALANMPGNRMHQMGFAQAHAAIEIERVERHDIGLGHAARSGISKFIRFADNKIVERAARIERRARFGQSLIDRLVLDRCAGAAFQDGGHLA